MRLSHILTLASLLIVTTSAWSSVRAYFNNNVNTRYAEPYRNIVRPGDDFEKIILDQIAGAKKSIYLAVQEFRLPLVAKALVAKRNQGLDVRVILEHDYNFTVISQKDDGNDNEYEASKLAELRAFVDVNRDGIISRAELDDRDAIHILRMGNVPVIDDTFDDSKGAGLMHHKFMIVDGRSTIVSTANFTMSCIHGDTLAPQSRGNANSLVLVDSINFARVFNQEFAQMWGNGTRGNFGHGKAYRGPQVVDVRGTRITIQFSPTSARFNWEETTNGLIGFHLAQAQRRVTAALFVFSDQRLADILEQRNDRGVGVGVIMEPKFAFREYSELLDMLGARMLNQKCAYGANNNPWRRPVREAGMAILPRGDVLHHKFAVVDNERVIVGSQNWSSAANFTNDETLLVIENKGVANAFTREYNRLKRTTAFGLPPRVIDQIRQIEAACAQAGMRF